MEINCLSCGHKIDIGEAYDDFEGQIRCYVCDGIMEIKTEEGAVKSVKDASSSQEASSTAGKEGQ